MATPKLTMFIEQLHDLQIPQSISVSPSGKQVVYATTFYFDHKVGEHAISTLWLAEVGQKHSARQLTSGLSNDHDPQWSPDGKLIAFVSDRAKPSKCAALYVLPLAGGEAYPVTPAEYEATIPDFSFSPDSKSIAFLSADEISEEKKAKDKENDDVHVWGEDWYFNRLRIVDVLSKEVSVLLSRDAEIEYFAWNDDGTSIAFSELRTPDVESGFLYGTTFHVLDVKSKELKELCHFPGPTGCSTRGNLVFAADTLYFLGAAAVTIPVSSSMVFSIDVHAKESSWKKLAHGVEDCALALRKAGGDVVVFLESGIESQIRMLGGKTLFSSTKDINSWSAAFTSNSDEVVIAVDQSDINHPTEVFSTTASGGALVQLSNHGKSLPDLKQGASSIITCRSADEEVYLDALWVTPYASKTADGIPSKPLPTVVLIHGGPYNRISEAFDPYYFMWAPLLLSKGFAVLMPNYRGGSGKGEAFAVYARDTGKKDYEDVITLTNHAVKLEYADKEKLLVGGWSQGGFLSFLCSVRNGTHGHGWKFQATIPGAGVSDQDTMCFTSDIGGEQTYMMGGGKPWELSKSDTRNRGGSAIWEFGDAVRAKVAIPPMLILHGEEDKRVPLEQAVGMRRALADAGLPFQYVTYPREGHIIQERKHLLDMAGRVLKWCELYIGDGKRET